jgi:hypothetical protein
MFQRKKGKPKYDDRNSLKSMINKQGQNIVWKPRNKFNECIDLIIFSSSRNPLIMLIGRN